MSVLLLLLLVLLHNSAVPAEGNWSKLKGQIRNLSTRPTATVKTIEEYGQLLQEVVGNKPQQLMQVMGMKMATLMALYKRNNTHNGNNAADAAPALEGADRMALKEIIAYVKQIYDEMDRDQAGQRALANPPSQRDVKGLGNAGAAVLQIGEFQLVKWFLQKGGGSEGRQQPVFIVFLAKYGDRFAQLEGMFGKLSDRGKQIIWNEWAMFDNVMGKLAWILEKAMQFTVGTIAGKSLGEAEIGNPVKINALGDIRLYPFTHFPGGLELLSAIDEEAAKLARVREFLLKAPKNGTRVGEQTSVVKGNGKGGNALSKSKSDVKMKVVNSLHTLFDGNGPTKGSEPIGPNNETHNVAFFEEFFAPHLEQFFDMLAADDIPFIFRLKIGEKNKEKILTVQVQNRDDQQNEWKRRRDLWTHKSDIGLTIDRKRNKGTMEEVEVRKEAEEEDEMVAENAGNEPKPMKLVKSVLLSELLVSLYAKIVERLEHLNGFTIEQIVAHSDAYARLFHAYNYALADVLFQRMEEVQDSYDVFYDAQTSFENDVPQSPTRKTASEEERDRRWTNMEQSIAIIREKKAKLLGILTEEMPVLISLLGYKDVGDGAAERAIGLAKVMETEMSMTLDNMELNWEVDCHEEDLEKCLFSEHNQLEMKMVEMSLFDDERRDHMSKVERFFDWIYVKINKRIVSLDKKSHQEQQWLKRFFLRKCRNALKEIVKFVEGKQGMDDMLIPFMTELKTFILHPMLDWAKPRARDTKNAVLALIHDVRWHFRRTTSQQTAAHFEEGTTMFFGKFQNFGKADNEGQGHNLLSAAINGLMKFFYQKMEMFQKLKQHLRVKRPKSMAELFGKLRAKLNRRKRGNAGGARRRDGSLITADTLPNGKEKYKPRIAQKLGTTLIIEGGAKMFQITVMNHGHMVAFALSTAYLVLTVIYMSAVLWISRHLLWPITCTAIAAELLNCGHYFALAFMILAGTAWIVFLMIKPF